MNKFEPELVVRFERVKRIYFNNRFTLKGLHWSISSFDLYCRKYKCWAIFTPGQMVIINRCLKGNCPNYVLEFLIYHECLHRYWFYHCKSFREAEKKFKFYHKAEAWLKKNKHRK